MVSMANVLSNARRASVIAALVEGNSIRATVRMTGVAKGTIVKLLVELGAACEAYASAHLVNLPCKRLQVDEIWAFCYAKAKNVPAEKQGKFGYGDVWTFAAIDADTKLIPSWLVGSRDTGSATELMQDLAGRLSGRIQLTTDGLKAYISAVEDAFGGAVDYAMLQKIYGPTPEGAERRYSQPDCIGSQKIAVTGKPDPHHVSTSYIERQNLTMRMSIRRFTRLTNAFSKKVENHTAHVAIHFFHYNFCRKHMSLEGKTPCQAAGVETRRWTLEDVVRLLPDSKS
jgi:IS1 family transposase